MPACAAVLRPLISHVQHEGSGLQPAELVTIMAAIVQSRRRGPESGQGTCQAAVAEAWKIWNLTMEGWTGEAPRPYGPTLEP